MQKDSNLTRESGRKQKITGTVIIGVGILFLAYGIVAACLMTQGYKEMAKDFNRKFNEDNFIWRLYPNDFFESEKKNKITIIVE